VRTLFEFGIMTDRTREEQTRRNANASTDELSDLDRRQLFVNSSSIVERISLGYCIVSSFVCKQARRKVDLSRRPRIRESANCVREFVAGAIRGKQSFLDSDLARRILTRSVT